MVKIAPIYIKLKDLECQLILLIGSAKRDLNYLRKPHRFVLRIRTAIQECRKLENAALELDRHQYSIQSEYFSRIKSFLSALRSFLTRVLGILNNFSRLAMGKYLTLLLFKVMGGEYNIKCVLRIIWEIYDRTHPKPRWLFILENELECSAEHSFFHAVHLVWLLLQIFESRLNNAWDPGLPGTTSISWPWTVKASLAVLWGVCWKYYGSPPNSNGRQVSEADDYTENFLYQAQDFSGLVPLEDSLYNHGTTITHFNSPILPAQSPAIDFRSQSYMDTIDFDIGALCEDQNPFDFQSQSYPDNIEFDIGTLYRDQNPFGFPALGNKSLTEVTQSFYRSIISPTQDHDREIVQQLTPAMATGLPFSNGPGLSAQQTCSIITRDGIQDAAGDVSSSSSNSQRTGTGQTDYTHPSLTFSPQSSLQYNGS